MMMGQAAPRSPELKLHTPPAEAEDAQSLSSPPIAGKRRATPAKDALAGACAGAVAKTVVAPIERVKLLMQLQFSIDKDCLKNGGKASSAGKHGAWEVTKRVYREEGLLAFWRGNTPNVIRQGGTAALNFMLMDWYKSAISPLLVWSLQLPSNRAPEKRQKRRARISSFLSGGLAGGTVTTVLYPVEFVRTRLAMDVGKGTADAPRLYGGMKDVCASIWRADGWKGLYQGYGIALAGVVLYRALLLGGLMMQAGVPKDERLYKNSLDCFRKVLAAEGSRGFFLGIGPNLVRSFGAALLLVTYDVLKIKI
ncbi:hypothetical protein ACHAXT_004416 [Thalassiosira profunda]